MRKLLFSLLCLIGYSQNLFAQHFKVSGIISDKEKGIPVAARIFILDNNEQDTLVSTFSDSLGLYSAEIKGGAAYAFMVEVKGYLVEIRHTELVQTTLDGFNFELYEKKDKEATYLADFEKNKYKCTDPIFLSMESDKLREYFKLNPHGIVSIRGCADFQEKNQKALADKRAAFVYQYFIESGLSRENLKVETFNSTCQYDGKPWINQRVDFRELDTKNAMAK